MFTCLKGAGINLLWQVVDGHPLIRGLVARSGGSVRKRVVARLLEITLVVAEMANWLKGLQQKEPFCFHASMPQEARGFGMIEAARGSLGHWMKVENGRTRNGQMSAPTTWNFAPPDAQGVAGALEQALVDALVRQGQVDPGAVQHIVRSFDPCMVSTVH
jgi:hydrogenase large subunit